MSGCFILKTDGTSRILLVNAVDHLILTNCIPDVVGVLAATEPPDLAIFVGTYAVTGILEATEPPDLAAFTRFVSIAGILQAIEAQDIAVFFGSAAVLLPSGSLASIEARDIAFFTGNFIVPPLTSTVPRSDWDYGVYKTRHDPPPRNWK